MSEIGNALAGAAAGLGGYLVQQAQTEYAAALRQAELDAREQVDVRSDDRQHNYRMTEEDARAKAQQENTRLSSNLAGGREAASDERSRGLLAGDPWMGDDGKMYAATRGGETVEFKGRPPAPKASRLTANEATDQARKDFQMWQAQDEANTGAAKGTGKVLNSDGSVADPQRWINNRARQYMAGQNATAPKPQSAPASVSPPARASYDPTGSIAAARAAIKQGKDRNAVIQRLRDNGITPPPDL